nr:MAG TPA_asm: nuclear receptor-binding SET domain-containing protein [Caudoviricetes sp.]
MKENTWRCSNHAKGDTPLKALLCLYVITN